MLSMFTTQSQTSSKLTSSGLAQTHGKIGTDDYSKTQSRASSVNAAGPSSNSKPENNQSYPLAQNFNFNSAVNESIVSKSSVYGDQYTTTGLELADQQAMSRLRQSADSRNRSDQVKSNSHQDDSQYRNNLLLVAKNPISISTNPTRNEEKQFRNSREDQLLSRPAEVASQSSYNRVAMSNTQSRNNSTLQTTQSYSNTEHEYQKNKVESDLQMVSPCAGGGTRNTPTTTGVTSSQQQKTIYQTSNPIGQESINSNVLHSKSQAKHRYEVLNKILKHQKNNTNDEGGAKSASGKELADTEIVKHQMDAVNNVLEEIMSSQTNKYDFQALRLATDFQQRQAKADKYLLQDRMAKMQRDRELGLKREKLMAQEIKSLREQLAIAKASKAFDESPIITPQIQADQRRSVQGTYTRSGVHQETLYSSFPPQISVPASQKLPDLRSSSVNEMRKSQLLIPKLDLSKVKGQFDKKNPHQTIQPKEKEEKPLFMNKKQAMRSLQATTDSIDFQKSQPFTPCDGVSSTNESMNSISKEIPDVKINTFKNEPISKSFKSYSRQASASMEQIKSKETGYPSNNSNTPYTGDQRKNKDQISAVRLKEGDSRNNVGDLQNVLVGIKHFEAKITAPKQSGTQATTLSGAPSVAQAQPMANYLHESISSPQHEDKGKGNSVKYMHEMQTHSSFDRASHVIPKKHGDAYKTIDVTQQSPFSSNTSNLDNNQNDRGNNKFTLQGNYTQNPLSSHNTSIDSYVASVHINDDKLDRQGRFSTVDVHGALANRKRSLPPVKIPILDFTKLQSNVTQSKKMNLIKKTLGCKSNSVMIQQSTSQPIKNMTAKQALIQQLKGF